MIKLIVGSISHISEWLVYVPRLDAKVVAEEEKNTEKENRDSHKYIFKFNEKVRN